MNPMTPADLISLDPSSKTVYSPGKVHIKHDLYLAIKNFNPDNKDPQPPKDQAQFLSFRAGEMILMTMEPNNGGWFEGYRHNDPQRLCGIAHKSTVKKINFK